MIETAHRGPFVHAQTKRLAIGAQCIRALPVPIICGHLALRRHWDGEFGNHTRRAGRQHFVGCTLSEAEPSEWQ